MSEYNGSSSVPPPRVCGALALAAAGLASCDEGLKRVHHGIISEASFTMRSRKHYGILESLCARWSTIVGIFVSVQSVVVTNGTPFESKADDQPLLLCDLRRACLLYQLPCGTRGLSVGVWVGPDIFGVAFAPPNPPGNADSRQDEEVPHRGSGSPERIEPVDVAPDVSISAAVGDTREESGQHQPPVEISEGDMVVGETTWPAVDGNLSTCTRGT